MGGKLPKQFQVICSERGRHSPNLTAGKVYTVIESQDCAMLIEDDAGEKNWYSSYLFEYYGEVTP